MANVLIESTKLDELAEMIAAKSGESVPMELDEMIDAVHGIPDESGGIMPTGNIDITHAGATDVTEYATATVPTASFEIHTDSNFVINSGVWKWRLWGKVGLDPDDGDAEGWLSAGEYVGHYQEYNAVASGTTITPSETAQTIGARYTMMQGPVTVSAIPSDYVGTSITRNDDADLTASGATVTAAAGYYPDAAQKTVASGTAGTPTATKGAVSNHSVSVTPSVTNTTGWISGSTKTGTAVSVSASELVSGSQTITSNGTVDVTNLASVVVNVSGGSSKNIQIYGGPANVKNNGYTASSATLTVAKTGTYKVSWTAWRSSSQGTMGTNLHRNNTTGTNQQTFTGTYGQCITLTNQSYTQGDVLTIYATSGSSSRTIYIANFYIQEN